MPYVPVSVDVYVAAYAGIMGALANVRQTTNNVALDYDHDTKVAGAFAQAFDTLYNKVAPNELQLEEIQSISNELFSNVFPTGVGSELPTGLSYTALAGAIIARLSQADAFFAATGIVPPTGGGSVASLLPQFNSIAVGAVGSGRLVDSAVPATVGVSFVFVKTVKDWFRWDPLSVATADNISVVALIANGVAAGRYFRCLIPAPEWMLQINWTVDPAAGVDENIGSAAAPIRTDAERQRRMGPAPTWTLGEYHLRYLSDLPTTDPVIITGKLATPSTNIYVHGNAINGQGKTTLASLAVDAITALNSATNTPLLFTSNGLVTSWTADGLLNRRVRMTSGANIGGIVWPIADLGAKQARMNEPALPQTFANPYTVSSATFSPALNDTFVVEDLVLVNLRISLTGLPTGSSTTNAVIVDSVIFDSLGLNGPIVVIIWGGIGVGGFSQQPGFNGLISTVSFNGCRFMPGGNWVAATMSLFNCYADDTASGTPVFRGYQNSSATRFMTQQRAGCRFIGVSDWQSGVKPWTFITRVGLFNNTAGPAFEVGGSQLNSTVVVWGVCGAGGTPWLLQTGLTFYYTAAPPGPAGYYTVDVTAAPGGAWISYRRANAVQTTAPAFDVATQIFTTYRALTPALLQATVAGGGVDGQWRDPVSGCGMAAL